MLEGKLASSWSYRQAEKFVREWKRTHPCTDCSDRKGEPVFYPPWQVDFDHRPGFKKLTIGHLRRKVSEEELRREIAECDVVCACCHREREHTRRAMRRMLKRMDERRSF